MSGGIAFVFDENGTLQSRCNPGMVDLKPVHKESIPELHTLIERHYEYTESPIAKRILDNWQHSINTFVRVMPREYARVLHERQRSKAEEMTRIAE